MPSFDVVSEVQMAEVTNAIDQARREIDTRYDFKGTATVIELREKESLLSINTVSEQKAEAVREIVQTRFLKRGVPIRNLDVKPCEEAGGSRVRQTIHIVQGIDQTRAKEIVRFIKDSKLKVQGAIQGDCVRVTGKQRDDLQAAIAKLKEHDFGVELSFKNFRD